MLTVDACFDAEEKPPYEPLGVLQGGELVLACETLFTIAAAARRQAGAKAWWTSLCSVKQHVIDGDLYVFDPARGFVCRRELRASPERMVEAFVEAFDRLLLRFKTELNSAGQAAP